MYYLDPLTDFTCFYKHLLPCYAYVHTRICVYPSWLHLPCSCMLLEIHVSLVITSLYMLQHLHRFPPSGLGLRLLFYFRILHSELQLPTIIMHKACLAQEELLDHNYFYYDSSFWFRFPLSILSDILCFPFQFSASSSNILSEVFLLNNMNSLSQI